MHDLQRIVVSYQWCMVGYGCNMILTLIKVVFEKNRVRKILSSSWSISYMWFCLVNKAPCQNV